MQPGTSLIIFAIHFHPQVRPEQAALQCPAPSGATPERCVPLQGAFR